jgi:hypothetical protein
MVRRKQSLQLGREAVEPPMPWVSAKMAAFTIEGARVERSAAIDTSGCM